MEIQKCMVSISHYCYRKPTPSHIQSLPDIDKPVRENSEPATATKDELITQLIDQIAQKDKRVLELTEQVSSQSQEIEELRREIGNKKRQIEEKDREVRYMFTRLMLREPDRSRVSEVHDSGGGPLNRINSKSDVDMLSEKLDRLESLVSRVSIESDSIWDICLNDLMGKAGRQG